MLSAVEGLRVAIPSMKQGIMHACLSVCIFGAAWLRINEPRICPACFPLAVIVLPCLQGTHIKAANISKINSRIAMTSAFAVINPICTIA